VNRPHHWNPPTPEYNSPANSFTVQATPVNGVMLLQRTTHSDSRGSFSRLHCAREYKSLGLSDFISPAQMNLSLTDEPGTVRGMHLLRGPAAEHKLVTCLAGKIHDVVIDLRPHSPTFMATFAVELDGAGSWSVVIPPGVAHGFQALERQSLVLYLHSERYRAELDTGVRADDPALGLEWPLPITLVSPRDQALPLAADYLG
jgi:dTDP-4-dehydrorhamnose 3,5-epimerase